MKVKSIIIILLIIFLSTTAYIVYLNTYSIFENNEIELASVENKKTREKFRLSSFQGNSTTNNSLKLYKLNNGNLELVYALETFTFYSKNQEFIYLNDSTVFLSLYSELKNDSIFVNLGSFRQEIVIR